MLYFDEEQEQKAKEKKENMQKRYMERLQKNRLRNQEKPSSAPKKEVKVNQKTKIKKMKKQVEQLERKIKALREENDTLKKENKSLKAKRFLEQQERMKWERKAQSIQQDYEKQQNQWNEKQQKAEETIAPEKRIRQLEKLLEKEQKKTKEWQKKVKGQRQHIKNLEYRLTMDRALRKEERNQKLEKELELVKKERTHYKNQYTALLHPESVRQCYLFLHNYLREETVEQYLIKGKNLFGELTERISALHKAKKKKKHEEEQEKAKVEKQQKEHIHEVTKETPPLQIEMGYVSFVKEKWMFVGLNNESYELENPHERFSLFNEKPVKVRILENKKAKIIKAYDIEPIRFRHKGKKLSLQKSKRTAKTYLHFGSFRVLIVGSRFHSSYVDRLKKHGLRVEWHNPFEESYERLNEKHKKSDITVICTSHVSHAVLDHIDKEEEKVELIEHDREETIAARVRYAAIRLGLLHHSS